MIRNVSWLVTTIIVNIIMINSFIALAQPVPCKPIGAISFCNFQSDPRTGGGLAQPIGSIGSFNDGGVTLMLVKNGAGDNDWGASDSIIPSTVAGTLSTGLLTSGTQVLFETTTTVRVQAGSAIFVDATTNPLAVTQVIRSWPEQVFDLSSVIGAQDVSHISVDNTGAIIETGPVRLSAEQIRDIVPLGSASHSDNISITEVDSFSEPTHTTTHHLSDLARSLGGINLFGNEYSGVCADVTLPMDKTIGRLYAWGINRIVNPKDPNQKDFLAEVPVPLLAYETRTASGASVVGLDPNNYDVGGVLTPVSNNRFTVQLTYMNRFSGATHQLYGQDVEFSNKASAEMSLFSGLTFIVPPHLSSDFQLRGAWILQEGVDDLCDIDAAEFFSADKFGLKFTSIGSGASTLSLQNVYASGPDGTIVANNTIGKVNITHEVAFSGVFFEVASDNNDPFFSVNSNGSMILNGDSLVSGGVLNYSIDSPATGATFTPDCSNGNSLEITLSENANLLAPVNCPVVGDVPFTIKVNQDGTGGWVLTFNVAYRFDQSLVPVITTAPSSVDFLSMHIWNNIPFITHDEDF